MAVTGLSPGRLAEAEMTEYDFVLYLGIAQNHDMQQGADEWVLAADIYVNYPEGSGDTGVYANIWVGDVHIDVFKGEPAVSLLGEEVSWPRLQEKINKCYKTHSECQRATTAAGRSLPKDFRVIDVARRCLVEKSDCDFVALSYVWGPKTAHSSSLHEATRASVDAMKKDGGLPVSRMPRTIEDAMAVCTRMGQRYLWTDRLCIIQDDVGDKKNQIEAMDDVYSSALLVLVAAYGDHMDFGIPGVGRLRRKVVQRSEEVAGLRVTNVIREVEDDPVNVWDSRGWTYQEGVLSRRRLCFTNTRAFYECERSIFHEDWFNAETSRDELVSSRLVIAEDASRFKSFARHLRHYTSRNLTHRSDAYAALYGISSSLYKDSAVNGTNLSMMISGLPRVDFDRALLWYADFGKSPVTRLETPQGTVLPTWSWASVMGVSADDQVHYQSTDFYGTLVPWYEINGPGLGSIGEAFNAHPDISNPDNDWRVYMAIACTNGCMNARAASSLPVFSLTTDSFPTVRKLFNARWKDYHSFCKEAILPIAITASELPPPPPPPPTTTTLGGALIATRTQTALLSLSPKPTYAFNILNTSGDRIGEICGDAEKLREQASAPGYDISRTKFEFIALSLAGIPFRPYSRAQLERKNYVDGDGNALDKVPVVYVLMIVREGGVARRRELGWVFLVDWVRVEREWKVVVLG
ncbi:hypothetical protein AJ79_00401 [Helicocarpus griseus UAMH5409]|uniref:Heterokaryon incompatibility domain-containing protein n=1 Tax=Helicocarpus griseus UAMH5409 TaxID=1447875 RepID=A0A2B7YCM8_9EURO|nr:hypothetical protein AJ79_00401 [Helicocarpus griseus UAMH5409]